MVVRDISSLVRLHLISSVAFFILARKRMVIGHLRGKGMEFIWIAHIGIYFRCMYCQNSRNVIFLSSLSTQIK